MKRITTIFIICNIIILSVFSTSAADSISFNLADAESKKGRLVEISVEAECSKKLSAALFEFTYDKSMFEFKNVKTSDDNTIVKANELDRCVKAIYLSTYGTDISNTKSIFTITLKALKEGTGYLDFSVYDCVDADVKSMQVGTCTSAEIKITGSGNDSNDNQDKVSEDNTKSDGKSSKRASSIKESTGDSTIDNLGLLNEIEDKNLNYIIIGVAIGVASVILLLCVYMFLRKLEQKFKKKEESTEDNK